MIHDPNKITSFGCGCGKSRVANAIQPQVSRITVYQVLVNSNVVGEFSALQEARAKATEVGGRVKVTTKTT